MTKSTHLARRRCLALVLAAAMLAGCGSENVEPDDSASETTIEPDDSASETTIPEGQTIRGSLTLVGGSTGGVTDCAGDGGFNDIGPGTAVTVRDGAGEVVGTSDLQLSDSEADLIERLTADSVAAGTAADEAEVRELVDTGSSGFLCPLHFDVDVRDVEFYQLTIGRRDLTIARADLEDQDWRMTSTLNGL